MITLDTSDFERALAVYAAKSKRSITEIYLQQARLIIKEAIALTPPGRDNRDSALAKIRGNRNVENDLRKLFYTVPNDEADKSINFSAIHDRARNHRGRVKFRGKPHLVSETGFNRYLRERLKKVGSLAAGWNAAAARLGYKPPAWIWRHTSPGAILVEITDNRIRIRMTNRVEYASKVQGLQKTLQRAVNKQRNRLDRQTKHALAAASPFKK